MCLLQQIGAVRAIRTGTDLSKVQMLLRRTGFRAVARLTISLIHAGQKINLGSNHSSLLEPAQNVCFCGTPIMLINAFRLAILSTDSSRQFKFHGISNAINMLNLFHRSTKVFARTSFASEEILEKWLGGVGG